jgi:hypothetical protein
MILQGSKGLTETGIIVRINDHKEYLRILIVVTNQWSDFVAATDVPQSKDNATIINRLNIEPDRWNRSNYFSQFQFVQHCGLASCVHANHQTPTFHFRKQLLKHGRDNGRHFLIKRC